MLQNESNSTASKLLHPTFPAHVSVRTLFPLKGATSQFADLEKLSLNCSSSWFVIRVNLLHPQPSLFFYGLVLSL